MAGKEAPYGSWKSPITSDLIVSGAIGLGQIALDGGDCYWTELRPAEGGRYAIVRRAADGRTEDVTPPEYNVRTRVHEYGGGAFAVADGVIYFSNFADQRLYRQEGNEAPKPITPEAALRYADGVIDRASDRMFCVREDHTASEREAVNTLVSVDLTGRTDTAVLVSGNDFYSTPRLSPDGAQLAWLTWNHPNMPWDGTELWVAGVREDGSLADAQLVAGGVDESIFQPEWSPEGVLHFISDRTGWWNLYRWVEGRIEPLCRMEAEFGKPQWVFGMSTYDFDADGRIICTYTTTEGSKLAAIDTVGQLDPIGTPYTSINELRTSQGQLYLIGGSPTELPALVQIDLASGRHQVLRRASEVDIDSGYLSVPEPIEFPTEGGLSAHGLYYAANNRDFAAPSDAKPPLLVRSHGGPTSATSSTLSPGIQYWTSRGIAVLDVNYGGSTGYGRDYRRRLNGQWGIVDVDDCANGARYLVERGDVDGERLAITGGSAGGYTTLCALTFRDLFHAGASHYGVSDAEALAKETHKFESRYLDGLIGPYPERADLYRERSAIHYTERLSCPVIFFQGLEDQIVPPNQAETMVEALRSKGLPVAYVAFEGEQHGFRRAENIKRALDGELYFYSRVFNFELADPIEPVPIDNL